MKSEKGGNNSDDTERVFRLITYCTNFLDPLDFNSLIPEALSYAARKRILDSDLITGVRPLSDTRQDEIEQVRKEAFGSAERVFALYTFDVGEAFDWFTQAVRESGRAEQFAKVFDQYRKAELHNSQVAENKISLDNNEVKIVASRRSGTVKELWPATGRFVEEGDPEGS